MEKVTYTLNTTRQALVTLEEMSGYEFSAVVRDATIQRFEYSCDLIWKLLKLYLSSEGIQCSSPKGCFREALQAGLLTETETVLGLEMIDDRNLTSHTYREEIAQEIYDRIPDYVLLMRLIIKKVEEG